MLKIINQKIQELAEEAISLNKQRDDIDTRLTEISGALKALYDIIAHHEAVSLGQSKDCE